MLYSYKNQYPQPLPFRITLQDGRTRTDPTTFTQEELTNAGYVAAPEQPELAEHQWVTWSETQWQVHTKTSQEIQQEQQNRIEQQWNSVRQQRDQMMSEFEWRYTRHERELRMLLPVTDNLSDIDTYMQALADITLQPDPFNITWPELVTS
jgi:hypothetical protein